MNNITILNFSGRNNGNCSNISNYIAHYHKRTNARIVRIPEYFSPCGNCNYECLTPGMRCPNINDDINQAMSEICQSDITYFIIPNYCGVPCSNYYAFSERSVGWLNGDRELTEQYARVSKKFIIISNSETNAFNEVIKRNAAGKSDVIYLASRKYGTRSTEPELLQSKAARNDLQEFLERDLL